MTEFTRFLKRGLIESMMPQQYKRNPLLVLGFSPELLELGLSDEELFDILRKYARSVLMQFHEDRAGKNPATVERQRMYAEVFEQVGDFKIFQLALQELKEKRSEENSDHNTMLQALRSQVESSRVDAEKLEEALKERVKAVDERDRIARRVSSQLEWQRLFPADSGNKRVIYRLDEVKTLLVLSFEYHAVQGQPYLKFLNSVARTHAGLRDPGDYKVQDSQEGSRKVVSEEVMKEIVTEWESFMHAIRYHRLGAIEGQKLVQRALDSMHPFPAINWTELHGFSQYPEITKLLRRQTKEPPVFAQQHVARHYPEGICPNEPKLSRLYRDSIGRVWSRIMREPRYVDELTISVARWEIGRGGVIGKTNAMLMGSYRFDLIAGNDLHHCSLPEPTMMAKGVPFLIEGHPIVTTNVIPRSARDVVHPLQMDAFFRRSQKKNLFSVRNVLLDVIE
jgi:hypothetical protein